MYCIEIGTCALNKFTGLKKEMYRADEKQSTASASLFSSDYIRLV